MPDRFLLLLSVWLRLCRTVVASKANVGAAFAYNGYWRMGWDEMANWPGAAANSFYAGAMVPPPYTTNGATIQTNLAMDGAMYFRLRRP